MIYNNLTENICSYIYLVNLKNKTTYKPFKSARRNYPRDLLKVHVKKVHTCAEVVSSRCKYKVSSLNICKIQYAKLVYLTVIILCHYPVCT